MHLSQQAFADKMRITRNWLALLEGGREPSEALKNLFEHMEAQWNSLDIPTESELNQASTANTVRETPGRSDSVGANLSSMLHGLTALLDSLLTARPGPERPASGTRRARRG